MKKVITLKNPVAITAFSCVGGKKEGDGPLSAGFDEICRDDYFGMKSWEKAETEMQKRSIRRLFSKRNINENDVSVAIGGDLCDQITSTAFAYRDISMPFLGQYTACATMAQSLAVGSVLVSRGAVANALVGASSHFCTAERQFRTPLDYGGKRTPTAQWTVTGSAHAFLEPVGKGPFITSVSFGQIVDLGITDANNMGARMAPAAAKTIGDFFIETGKRPEDYDGIFTGDLGTVGSDLLKDLMFKEYKIQLKNHNDCGLLIFDKEKQKVQSGRSGRGCSGCVLASYILPKLISGRYKKVLFVATGAMLSPTTTMQKESIPSIAHLVEISKEK